MSRPPSNLIYKVELQAYRSDSRASAGWPASSVFVVATDPDRAIPLARAEFLRRFPSRVADGNYVEVLRLERLASRAVVADDALLADPDPEAVLAS